MTKNLQRTPGLSETGIAVGEPDASHVHYAAFVEDLSGERS